ncbi:MAG: hypothetical protein ACRDND_28835, partial [Streptosporangiaceae bacterium]
RRDAVDEDGQDEEQEDGGGLAGPAPGGAPRTGNALVTDMSDSAGPIMSDCGGKELPGYRGRSR